MAVKIYNDTIYGHASLLQPRVANPSPMFSWMSTILLLLISYVSLCHVLRWRRITNLRAKLNYPDRESLSRMTNDDAHLIIKNIASYEFPLLYDVALRFTLFKTYTIASIASVVGLSDLSKPKLAPKRYEDTSIIYECFAAYRPSSPLLHKAIGRVNYLHAPYIKSGRILNRDMVYVIFVSILEPIRFIKLYEWRELNDMEIAALVTVWKYIGEMMNIDYKAELKKSEWKDGIEFFEDLSEWAVDFEAKYMRPTKDVQNLGAGSRDLLLSAYPKFLRPAVDSAFLVLMGDRLRFNFGLPEPNVRAILFTYGALTLRKLFLRFLCLPRFLPVQYLSKPDKTGRIKHHRYLKEAWYNPPTLWARWGPMAWYMWATGMQLPGDAGTEQLTQGFRWEDIGPRRAMGKGAGEAYRYEAEVREKSKCPFSALSAK